MYNVTLIVSALLAVLGIYAFLLSAANVRFLKSNRDTIPSPGRGHKVSVLIPARNEESRLPELLDSLVVQDYPDYEILIVDDNSTDSTWSIIEDYMSRYPGLVKGIKGKEKKDKVANGKIYALDQIEAIAEGEYLLATDADTIHKPGSISYAVTLLEKYNLDMLSGFPEERCGTVLANAITAAMNFAAVLYIPLALVCRHPNRWFTLANGQFILMRHHVMDELGGYKAVNHKLVDDVSLAKHFVENKRRYALVNVSNVVACRMYDTTGEAFLGITRSIGGIFPATLWVILPILFVVAALLFIAFSPALVIALCFFLPQYLTPLLLMLVGTLGFGSAWYRCARMQGYTPLCSLLWPYTIVMICVMYLYSYYVRSHGKSFKWKGRDV